MKIETKYNIGDEVWVSNIFGEPVEVKIYGIVVEEKYNKVLIGYHIGIDENACALRKEENVFPTKEEFLKSL